MRKVRSLVCQYHEQSSSRACRLCKYFRGRTHCMRRGRHRETQILYFRSEDLAKDLIFVMLALLPWTSNTCLLLAWRRIPAPLIVHGSPFCMGIHYPRVFTYTIVSSSQSLAELASPSCAAAGTSTSLVNKAMNLGQPNVVER